MSFSSKPPEFAPRSRYEHDDRGVSGDVGGHCRDDRARVTSSSCSGGRPITLTRRENRGLFWLLGAFVICPCHVPLTLGLVATLFAGTAVGVAVSSHPYLVGALLSAAWLVATLYALRLLRDHPATE